MSGDAQGPNFTAKVHLTEPLGESPDFFISAGASATDIVLFAVLLVAGPPVALLIVEAIAGAIRACVLECRSRAKTRSHAERFGWAQTTAGQLELFRAALARRTDAPSVRAQGSC